MRIARRGAFHISHDSRRPRAASASHSPNWCPDAILIHGHESGAHLIVDVACPSVVKRTALPAAALATLIVAADTEASKHGLYGHVAPHVVLPFVVESGGALGKEARGFFQRVQAKVKNRLTPKEEELASWSALGFCNYYHQALSVANLKGLGHFFSVAAAVLRPS